MAQKRSLLARLVLPPQPAPEPQDPPRWVDANGNDTTCRACQGSGNSRQCRGCDGNGHYGR